MKRFLVVVLMLVFVSVFQTTGMSADWTGKLALRPTGGVLFPVTGSFDDNRDLNDVVDAGPGFGLAVRYGLTRSFAVEGSFGYSWMYVKDEYKPFSYTDPAYVMPNITLNGVFNLGSLFNPEGRIAPYLTAGIGLHPWKFSEDGITGDPVNSPLNAYEEYSKTSFGLNFGAGLEVFLGNRISVFGNGKYFYVFAKDEEAFGSYFDDQGFATLEFGLSYHFPFGK